MRPKPHTEGRHFHEDRQDAGHKEKGVRAIGWARPASKSRRALQTKRRLRKSARDSMRNVRE